MKKIAILLLGLTAAGIQAAEAIQLHFLNKTDAPINFIVGTNEQQPRFVSKIYTIAPGKEVGAPAPKNNNAQLLIYQANKPQAAFIHSFNTANKDKFEIRILLEKGAFKIEPQTSLGMAIKGNVTPKDMAYLRSGPYEALANSTTPQQKPQPKPESETERPKGENLMETAK